MWYLPTKWSPQPVLERDNKHLRAEGWWGDTNLLFASGLTIINWNLINVAPISESPPHQVPSHANAEATCQSDYEPTDRELPRYQIRLGQHIRITQSPNTIKYLNLIIETYISSSQKWCRSNVFSKGGMCFLSLPLLIRAVSMWLSLSLMIAAPGPVSGPEPGVTQPSHQPPGPGPGLAQTCYFLTNGPGPGVTLRPSDIPTPGSPLTPQCLWLC